MTSQLRYQLALTLIPGIGDVLAKNLVSYCGGPEKVFKAKRKELIRVPGIDLVRAEAVLKFNEWKKVDEEISFIEKNKISAHFYPDQDYPARLKGLTDSPALLFTKGNMNLNHGRMVAMVGTRHATDYGKDIIEILVEGFKPYDVTIVSGLAYGIDIHAHRAALKHEMPTIGVLAHGLNRLYPGQHRSTAVKMLENGGLVTEFKSSDEFEPQNFPKRNRIVAGLSDAVIIVESAINGGALITAEIANNYNRDVFCIPGKVGEKFSEGCNYFIRTNKAGLVEKAADVASVMGWEDQKTASPKQKELFIQLDDQEEKIVVILKNGDGHLHIDEISKRSELFGSQLASTLLNLEFKGVIASMPGKVYRLV